MKIVHLTSVHDWNDTRIFVKMCRSLVQQGHDVHLVVPRRGIFEVEVIEGVTIHPVSVPIGRMYRMTVTVLSILQVAQAIRADLYHFHDPEFLPWAPYWQWRLQRPFIYDVHEDYRGRVLVKEWIPLLLRGVISWLVAKLESWAGRRLSGVVVVTPGIGKYFDGLCKVVIVRNFPRLDEFEDEVCDTPAELGHFVYVSGVLTEERGIDQAIAAIAMAGDGFRLSIAGVWMNDAYRQRCESMKGWSQVDFLGYIDRNDVVGALRKAQAGLEIAIATPGYEETYPTKLFECMASARPIIIADFPVYRPFIDRATCGILIDPSSPARISEAMKWVRGNPIEASEMGKRGKAAIETDYNWTGELPSLLELYESSLYRWGLCSHARSNKVN